MAGKRRLHPTHTRCQREERGRATPDVREEAQLRSFPPRFLSSFLLRERLMAIVNTTRTVTGRELSGQPANVPELTISSPWSTRLEREGRAGQRGRVPEQRWPSSLCTGGSVPTMTAVSGDEGSQRSCGPGCQPLSRWSRRQGRCGVDQGAVGAAGRDGRRGHGISQACPQQVTENPAQTDLNQKSPRSGLHLRV